MKALTLSLAFVVALPPVSFATEITDPSEALFEITLPFKTGPMTDGAHPRSAVLPDTPQDAIEFFPEGRPLALASETAAPEITPQYLKEVSLSYFKTTNKTVEPTSAYPFEGWRQKDFTQPTAIGFYGLLLANVITGKITTQSMTVKQAKNSLNKMMDSLLRDQAKLGYKGLLPWMSFNGRKWERKGDLFGQQVALGDNANLAAALAAASGLLSDPHFSSDSTIQNIRNKIESFLTRQQEGYSFLFDSGRGLFRRGWNFVQNDWIGGSGFYHDYLGDEFRGPILFLVLRYGFPDSAYTRLSTAIKEYTLLDGTVIQTLAPWDGGAFQMLWPSLTTPESESPVLQTTIQNFIRIALDFSPRNNLDGFLSASYTAVGQYSGNAGIGAVAVNSWGRNELSPSIYTLGLAYAYSPQAMDPFLKKIFNNHPDLMTDHGIWEGLTATGTVVQEQISANVTSFVLGLAGTGPEAMRQYLIQKGLYSRLLEIYQPKEATNLIGMSTASFSWSDQPITFSQSGSYYHLSSPGFYWIGTAFFQEGINLVDQRLRFRYRSTTDIGSAKLEFKERDFTGNLIVRHGVSLVLENTEGIERDLTLELPDSLGLMGVDEVVLVLGGGTGAPLDLTLITLEALPKDSQDVVAQSTGSISWGDKAITGYASVSQYSISSPEFYSSGTAFFQSNIDATGRLLRLRYRSTANVESIQFEFKVRDENGNLRIVYATPIVPISDTQGGEQEIFFQLPSNLDLSGIDEIVMLLFGGVGQTLEFSVLDLNLL